MSVGWLICGKISSQVEFPCIYENPHNAEFRRPNIEIEMSTIVAYATVFEHVNAFSRICGCFAHATVFRIFNPHMWPFFFYFEKAYMRPSKVSHIREKSNHMLLSEHLLLPDSVRPAWMVKKRRCWSDSHADLYGLQHSSLKTNFSLMQIHQRWH